MSHGVFEDLYEARYFIFGAAVVLAWVYWVTVELLLPAKKEH